MTSVENTGYQPHVIEDFRQRMGAMGRNFLFDDTDEQSEEYAHFYFIGKYEGKDVVYDAVMYTLRLHHESELYEIAEHQAAKHFPDYKKITYEEDENGNLEALDPRAEEIGLYMAEVIMQLEEEDAVKVREHVDVDAHAEFGVSLDIGMHVEKITPAVIEKFVREYNDDTLRLDETLYTFQTHDEAVE